MQIKIEALVYARWDANKPQFHKKRLVTLELPIEHYDMEETDMTLEEIEKAEQFNADKNWNPK